MEHKNKQHKRELDYIFTAIMIVTIVVIFFLSGRRQTEQTANITVSPVPSPTNSPFGRMEYAFVDDLATEGLTMRQEGDSYHINGGELVLSIADGYVTGFTLRFLLPTPPADDGSSIAKALIERAESDKQGLRQEMETVLLAVLSAYDAECELPDTIRREWAAAYGNFIETQKTDDASYGDFRSSRYTGDTAEGTLLCVSLQHDGD